MRQPYSGGSKLRSLFVLSCGKDTDSHAPVNSPVLLEVILRIVYYEICDIQNSWCCKVKSTSPAKVTADEPTPWVEKNNDRPSRWANNSRCRKGDYFLRSLLTGYGRISF